LGSPAARLKDEHICLLATHAGGPITGPCCTSVLIGGEPAATAGDSCHCAGIPDKILTGSPSVFIGGKPAARKGDKTVHGGVIITGCASVLIGDTGGGLDTTADFVMPSEEEKIKIINETIQACIMLLRKKLNLLKKNDSTTLKDFSAWFGSGDEGAKKKILKRIKKTLKFCKHLTKDNFEDITNENNKNDTYAFAYGKDISHTIFLDIPFWTADVIGKDSKSEIIIHELSHFKDIGNTKDFVYGKYCLDLAKKNPTHALNNADSFAYFIGG
jgi:uncharacterized Zn-binding protein involved in type VI secretion